MWIAGAARSREIDRLTTEQHGVASAELMRAAGEAVWQHARLIEARGRVVVLCGPGNNGGDGFAASLFAHEEGRSVVVWCSVGQDDLKGDAAEYCRQAITSGVRVQFSDSLIPLITEDDLVIDALLGIGATGETRGRIREAIEAVNSSEAAVLAVDVSSGIECDSGDGGGAWVRADRTVVIGLPKPFLFQSDGLEAAGTWVVEPITFSPNLLNEPTGVRLTCRSEMSDLMPRRRPSEHKVSAGRVLVVAGSPSMPGAAILCVEAAFRSGAGMVQLVAPPGVCDAVLQRRPETLTTRLGGAADLLQAMQKADSAVFGPGLGQSEEVRSLLSHAWAEISLPCCIDADALNAAASGVELPAGPSVLTPHAGELSRLIGLSSAEIGRRRLQAAGDASTKFGKTVLLKGPYSVTASPDQPLSINSTGCPGMASAGMGDVLAGVVGTLLAQGLSSHDACTLAAYWHGLAGEICAHSIGEVGFTASDLCSALPLARATILSCGRS
jgi:NAD(P)H-hydrate epimerase